MLRFGHVASLGKEMGIGGGMAKENMSGGPGEPGFLLSCLRLRSQSPDEPDGNGGGAGSVGGNMEIGKRVKAQSAQRLLLLSQKSLARPGGRDLSSEDNLRVALGKDTFPVVLEWQWRPGPGSQATAVLSF